MYGPGFDSGISGIPLTGIDLYVCVYGCPRSLGVVSGFVLL